MTQSLWGAATDFSDTLRIPIHVGDTLRTKHFIHYRRRRQMYIYHVVIGPSVDPQVMPLQQVITGRNTGGNCSLGSFLRNWPHVEVITDNSSGCFYDRMKVKSP